MVPTGLEETEKMLAVLRAAGVYSYQAEQNGRKVAVVLGPPPLTRAPAPSSGDPAPAPTPPSSPLQRAAAQLGIPADDPLLDGVTARRGGP